MVGPMVATMAAEEYSRGYLLVLCLLVLLAYCADKRWL